MTTLDWILRLISVAVFFQGLEIFLIRESWSDKGIWNWNILRKDFETKRPAIQKVLNFLLQEKIFFILVLTEISLAGLNIFIRSHLICGVLFVSVVLTAIRWRGTFNGGSDYMTALVLISAFVAGFFPKDSIGQMACFAYIAVQTILSYFLAGMAKLKEKTWWSGQALREFLTYSNYIVDKKTKAAASKPTLARMASWIILVFECSFPLAILDYRLCAMYVTIGFLFHLENFFVLGLNRFVFAWLAAYPALYAISHKFTEQLFGY